MQPADNGHSTIHSGERDLGRAPNTALYVARVRESAWPEFASSSASSLPRVQTWIVWFPPRVCRVSTYFPAIRKGLRSADVWRKEYWTPEPFLERFTPSPLACTRKSGGRTATRVHCFGGTPPKPKSPRACGSCGVQPCEGR